MHATPLSPHVFNLNHHFVTQLMNGLVDFLEAGDCRRPGQTGALRAIATGHAGFPLAISAADKDLEIEQMQKVTMTEGLSLLSSHANKLAVDIGPAARIFTVKLRKNHMA